MRLSARHGSAASGGVGCTLLMATLAAWPLTATAQPAAPEPCTNSCPPIHWDTLTKIHLSEVDPGICGITAAHKRDIADLSAQGGDNVGWIVCSTCPYDATVVLDNWSGRLTTVFETMKPPIFADDRTTPLPVKGCGEERIEGSVKSSAVRGSYDFKMTVQTGTAIRHYDPQLQIRDPDRSYVRWWVLLGALAGLAGGVMLGRFLWRARR